MTFDQFIARIKTTRDGGEIDRLAAKLPTFGDEGERAVVTLLMDESPLVFGNALAVIGTAGYYTDKHPLVLEGVRKMLDHARVEARQMAIVTVTADMLEFSDDAALTALHRFYSASDANKAEFRAALRRVLSVTEAAKAQRMVEAGSRD